MKLSIPLLILCAALHSARAQATPTLPDHTIDLNANWRFLLQNQPSARAAGFNDSGWDNVSLPHCWNVQAGQDGDSNAYYKGAGWYRRHVRLPSSDAGRQFYLRFDGAFVVTDVFVNGEHAGTHDGGFAAFCFDVTRFVKPGGDNVIAVRVDGSPDGHAGPPQGGDYTKFGGLYRGARLLVRNPVHISTEDAAGPGVYLDQMSVTREAAKIRVRTLVANSSARKTSPTVRVRILTAGGRPVAAESAAVTVAPRTTGVSTISMQIRHPHLWNGVLDPYLYRAVVEIAYDGKVLDRVEQPLGLRYFRIDPEAGFVLNGRPYALHGVNRHQDRLGEGWAITSADTREDVGLICDLGANCLRTAHYQQADDLYTLCDAKGVVVWTELCMVNSVRRSEAFKDSARRQLVELVKQNYNHPSICFWSLWNEISFEGGKGPNDDDLAFLKGLNDTVKRLDRSRLTTAASNSLGTQRQTLTIPDVIAWNGYPGWYGGKPGEWDRTLGNLRSSFPGRAVGVSEYGAGASVFHHEAAPKQPSAGGPFHPEEWQSLVHEADWKALSARHNLWGTFIWNMFDFASITRKEGDHPGRNDKGLVTYDRQVRKDAYFYYQAQWTRGLMAHITSGRFNPRPSGPAELKVYSNADTVELRLNGKPQGARSGDGGVFRWDVTLPEGSVRVEAVGYRGNERASDAVAWTCSAAAPSRIGPK
ncbi:MAG TPA: glycoside hydrolase family 2 TIM barrel-domain containing protein [Armatimonadota bacterium]|jgi:beta-galactosidase